MSKYVSKEDLHFEDGYILNKENEIVYLDVNVCDFLNDVETAIQQARYLAGQPAFQEAPSLNGFERDSAYEGMFIAKPTTPLIDEMVETSLAFMKEVEEVNNTDKINEFLRNFAHEINWIKSDKIVVMNEGKPYRFDLPIIGDPLKISADDLVKLIVEEKLVDFEV